jgi:signal transduction histidine kinase
VSNNHKFHILVVDDEPRLRLACRRVLEPQGFTISEAEDGQQGLELIESESPDLVLIDLMMPNVSGMEVLEAARSKYPDLAFIVITGYATLEKAVEAMKQGADDFIAKPFKPQELRMVVERALKRVRTLQDMALEKGRTRVLVESMTNGVLVVDEEGKVALMNPALRRLASWPEGDPVGLTLEEVLPCPDVIQALKQILASPDPEKKGAIQCQISLRTAEEPVHLQVTCLPFRDGRGNPVGAMALFDDVTAWRRLDELKSEYVSTVAHDIASPLGSVLGQLQTMQRGLAGELTEKQAHLISRAALRIQGIVDLSQDLLNLAKMESGALGEPEEVDLAAILKEAVDLFSEPAQEKGQNLSLEIDPQLPPVRGVARALMQVFQNLVSNAVRYTPQGGEIKVSAHSGEGVVEIAVQDNGFGIPAEDHQRIFQRFYRVKDANTRMIVGTGLGLPIVKRVVEDHKGSIRLESQPGKGSTFIVSLPQA